MDEEEVTAYKCTECLEIYTDEDEANSCHGNAVMIDGWSCGRCGTIYESRDEAKKCCSA